jgi:hypothetical protein
MLFQPDVVVLALHVPNVSLLAEVKRSFPELAGVESQLRQYMLDRRCSLALLVSPRTTRMYRDTFKDYTADSIELVGEYDTADFLGLDSVPDDERALHEAVMSWLERLACAWPTGLPQNDIAKASVVQYLVPEVAQGRIMSGSFG